MSIARGTKYGTPIRWIGEPHSEKYPGGQLHVEPGDIGTFLDFDGPGSDEVVVTFPNLGTMVFPKDSVEVVE